MTDICPECYAYWQCEHKATDEPVCGHGDYTSTTMDAYDGHHVLRSCMVCGAHTDTVTAWRDS